MKLRIWQIIRCCLTLPVGELLPGLILINAISHLNFALDLIALAIKHYKLITNKLAPPLFDAAPDLFPITLDTIEIHFNSLGG